MAFKSQVALHYCCRPKIRNVEGGGLDVSPHILTFLATPIILMPSIIPRKHHRIPVWISWTTATTFKGRPHFKGGKHYIVFGGWTFYWPWNWTFIPAPLPHFGFFSQVFVKLTFPYLNKWNLVRGIEWGDKLSVNISDVFQKNLYNVWAALFARPGWFAESIDIILMGISTSKLTSVLESCSDK